MGPYVVPTWVWVCDPELELSVGNGFAVLFMNYFVLD